MMASSGVTGCWKLVIGSGAGSHIVRQTVIPATLDHLRQIVRGSLPSAPASASTDIGREVTFVGFSGEEKLTIADDAAVSSFFNKPNNFMPRVEVYHPAIPGSFVRDLVSPSEQFAKVGQSAAGPAVGSLYGSFADEQSFQLVPRRDEGLGDNDNESVVSLQTIQSEEVGAGSRASAAEMGESFYIKGRKRTIRKDFESFLDAVRDHKELDTMACHSYSVPGDALQEVNARLSEIGIQVVMAMSTIDRLRQIGRAAGQGAKRLVYAAAGGVFVRAMCSVGAEIAGVEVVGALLNPVVVVVVLLGGILWGVKVGVDEYNKEMAKIEAARPEAYLEVSIDGDRAILEYRARPPEESAMLLSEVV
ncbi:unnamed protein product [Vitrella brassicaformis CCMP3155]|uniref:Uncharacterized protein n=2 Tax=Vitrella brassicaformis TaxID=1169539 RepID=A0A0G4ETG3_VITBC|nr:unnamed protein product [Vitrella brassicaformis CCMP3155]|mmetsp:Transcript_28742/g.82956  ORF Transcript_28742/g.82956 Transcript_28742/m.82956 type:complete len:362 (-) Transcript_28742:3277-4362(-)|eukprot:CEM01599.1 unnamed protein product [Vitrella brassicaformis CCMP3155]